MVEHLHPLDRAESLPPGVEVVTDPEKQRALMPPDVVHRFAEELTRSIYEPTLRLRDETKGRIGSLLSSEPWEKKKTEEQLALADTDERKDYVANKEQSMQNLLERGHLTVVTVNGKPAAIMGFSFIGSHPKNRRNVFEICHTVVLPEFQGNKFSKILLSQTMERVKNAAHGDAYLLSYTKTGARVKDMEARGAKNISPKELVDIYEIEADHYAQALDWNTKMEALGWKRLLLDLKQDNEE